MLDFLKISNLALINSALIDFDGGFTCVTGETGAGKSVILGALAMLAGNRCGKEIVGSFADACSVEASISFSDSSKLDELLEQLGLPRCEESSLILSRSIGRTKFGRIFINGALAPLSSLSRLGEFWIDFHGPGEPQKLFSLKNQLDMLDSFCGANPAYAAYGELFSTRKEILAEIKDLSEQKKLSPDELDFIKSQIAAIDSLDVSDESVSELEQSYKIAEMASDVSEKSLAIISLINGDDSISEKLRACNRLAADLSKAGASAETLCDRLSAATIEVDDIAAEFESLAESSNMSAAQVEEIRKKMSKWMGLVRKYGASASAVRAARDEMVRKISLQSDVKASLQKLRDAELSILKKLQPLADEIFKLRSTAAKKLQTEVEKLLKRLGFKSPIFEATVCRENEASQNFGSVCEFNFSANAGQPPRPLVKIASSGELARVMLALKTILAEADKTPVLVFDEVDANVGGEVGAEVGRELAHLAEAHQVFCITHLPQVAAFAQNHFLVEKFQKRDSTEIEISSISTDSKKRVVELARMLGDRNSESALAHAKELLEHSK